MQNLIFPVSLPGVLCILKSNLCSMTLGKRNRHRKKSSAAIWWKVENYSIWTNSDISRSSEQLIVCWPGWLSGEGTGQLDTTGQSGLGSNPMLDTVKFKTNTRGFTKYFI